MRFSPGLPGFDCIWLEVQIENRKSKIENVRSVSLWWIRDCESVAETAAVPTLYEDWQRRREGLLSSVTAAGPVHREARIRVLDHLLNQYRGKPEAAAAARFPFRPGLLLTHRAAVAHHYLGGRALLESQAPSSIRAAVILGRIAGLHPQSSVADGRSTSAGWQLAKVEARSVYWASGYWQDDLLSRIGKAIQATLGQHFVYLTVLERLQLAPRLPDWAIMYMFERLDNPAVSSDSAAGLFVCCENECVLDYALLAWRDRLAANGPDSITRGLRQVFFRPHWKERAAEKIRVELASHSLAIRIEALRLIADLGGLSDVGLLLDLLALGPSHDEDAGERDMMLGAAEKLAGMWGEMASRPTAALTPQARPAATLYEDWLQRRRRLTHLSPVQQQYVVEHRALLDFLLERCRHAPQAGGPARFAAPPQPFANRQAVLVYHQLGRTEVRGGLTATEAGKRASSILRRIRSLDPQASAREFVASGVLPSQESQAAEQQRTNLTQAQLQSWAEIEEQIAIRGFRPHVNLLYKQIAAALELSPELPEKAVYYLAQHLDNPEAVELLGRCASPCALEYAFGAWRQRVVRKRVGRAVSLPLPSQARQPAPRSTGVPPVNMGKMPMLRGPVRLLELFFLPAWRRKAAERFRRELISADSAKVRIQAARALGRLGTLDDVGLLSDLLCLPPWHGEEPRERPSLLQAMQRLGRSWA